MLRFFRNIRQKLVEQDNVRKYIWYAAGEILLVMVGILLALQVNNWNNSRITNEKVEKILSQTAAEIRVNVTTAERIIDFYTFRDSLFIHTLNSSSTIEDFNLETDTPQLYLLFNARQFVAEGKAFDALSDNLDNIPVGLDGIVRDLQELHSSTLVAVANSYERMDDISDSYRTHLVYNTNWFSDFYKSEAVISNEVLDHFLNDPLYKNNLTWYRTAMTNNYTKSLRRYIHEARIIHQKINEVLEKPSITEIDYLSETELNTLDKYVGTYVERESNLVLEIVKDTGGYFILFPNGNRMEMFFINGDTFYYNNGLKGEIINSQILRTDTDLRGSFFPFEYERQ